MTVLAKDPDSDLEYTLDWDANSELISGETISTSQWTVDPTGGLSLGSTGIDNSDIQTSIRLNGGTASAVYEIKNVITTSEGNTFSRRFTVKVMRLPA